MEKENLEEEHDQETAPAPAPLLSLEDLKGKIDFSSDENWTPFECLRKIASIALSKLLRQEGDQEGKTSRRRKVEERYFVAGGGDARLFQKERVVVPNRLRLYIETELEGREVKLMIQKKLFMSDVDPSKGRLSIPHKKLLPGVLTEEEEEMLRSAAGGGGGHEEKDASLKVVGMKVKLVDPSLKVWESTLKRWNMTKKGTGVVNYIYVLSSPWNDVVKENGLSENAVVRLWGFRMGGGDPGRLGLALVRVDPSECEDGR